MKSMVSAAALSLLLAATALAEAPGGQAQTETSASSETRGDAGVRAAPTETATQPASTGSISTENAPVSADTGLIRSGALSSDAAGVAALPDTTETCIAAAADLGSAAESKALSSDHADRLDALFSKMETLCDGQQFAEAMDVAKNIKTMLDGR